MKFVFVVLLLTAAAMSQTWGTANHSDNQTTSGCTSTGTTCTITTTSTTAHSVLVFVQMLSAGTISSMATTTACNVTWTHAASTNISFGSGALDMYYCLDAVAGVTSIVSNISNSGAARGGSVIEFKVSTGTPSRADSNSATRSTSSTTQSGIALTVTNPAAVVQAALCSSAGTLTPPTGYTGQVNGLGGSRWAYFQVPMSSVPAPTWGFTTSATCVVAAVGFNLSLNAATQIGVFAVGP